mmetsp:Transcript_56080/g.62782  ORF Transcript_56080/g.62782 Transcript_56080/m.62782 type:complete len:88 (-) Transcript_56080:15-278(-)
MKSVYIIVQHGQRKIEDRERSKCRMAERDDAATKFNKYREWTETEAQEVGHQIHEHSPHTETWARRRNSVPGTHERRNNRNNNGRHQ